MVTASFKQQSAILASTPQFLFQPTLENYVDAFGKFDILKSLQNSLFVALVTVVVSLVLGTPAAYAIARFEFKGKRDIWFWFISNRMLSPIVVALPFFLIARNFRLLDTTWALILIYLTFNVPIVVWICADQFRNIPKELDEAATLEGYNSFAIFLEDRVAAGDARSRRLGNLQFYLLLERIALRPHLDENRGQDRAGRRHKFHERL